ncbi:acyl-CoA dehydrogenase family protein [Roseomonas aerophila]|uniref:Acyl-CoA dehydrogenase family protein n=1 Tax=Teichococcus aerophilus TaxID=1224513 RepID=A0ABR7RNI5_9PROT|nr:acyl-CoA dehydrogenase family protein [Pseudoroseomonas aerophila]MBC9207898.1 acyl-CoA dehydrogenase family protein [Pseudoroseomonas aerophila]
MPAGVSEWHVALRDAARRFADDEIAPLAVELDETEQYPAELYRKLAEAGLFGISVPEELGGAGADVLAYAMVMEELSRGYASVADQVGLVELLGTLLTRHGTPSQQERYLRPLLKAELRCAYALTEAEAGSDLAGLKTRARRTADGWVLDGAKLWIHNAPVADFAAVLARTDPEAGHRGMSILLVDLNSPGVTRDRKEHKMGQRASQVGGLRFDNVQVPADALLGEEGRGFHMMMSVLDKGRVGIGALALGILQAALEDSIDYAKQRRQFGQAIGDFQAVQWMIADMAKDAHAARLMILHAAQMLDGGGRATLEASMAKCFASDAAVSRTADAVQIHGGSGYIRGVRVERLFRDAKITQIYEGTNQIQRMIMARSLLA